MKRKFTTFEVKVFELINNKSDEHGYLSRHIRFKQKTQEIEKSFDFREYDYLGTKSDIENYNSLKLASEVIQGYRFCA